MTLSDDQVLLITRSAVLLARRAHVLSDFEVETIAEVGRRFVQARRDAVVTQPEWQVIEDSIAAMQVADALAQRAAA